MEPQADASDFGPFLDPADAEEAPEPAKVARVASATVDCSYQDHAFEEEPAAGPIAPTPVAPDTGAASLLTAAVDEPEPWEDVTAQPHSYDGTLQVPDADVAVVEPDLAQSLSLDHEASPEPIPASFAPMPPILNAAPIPDAELPADLTEAVCAVQRAARARPAPPADAADPAATVRASSAPARIASEPASSEHAGEEPSEATEGEDAREPVDETPERAAVEEPLSYAAPGCDDVPARGGVLTIPLLCLGLGLLACCVLIPLCDANRRAAFERLRLRRDLATLQRQVATNEQFLRKVVDDPGLAERLAQRQLHKIRIGTRVLPMPDYTGAPDQTANATPMSPFQIVAVPPPASLPPYQPVGGAFASLCYNPRSRLYLLGGGLMLVAAGLVLGYSGQRKI